MGTFGTQRTIRHVIHRHRAAHDTATGLGIDHEERAIVRIEGRSTPPLGARMREGLNLTIDPARKRLVAAGPLPAAGIRGSSIATDRGTRPR